MGADITTAAGDNVGSLRAVEGDAALVYVRLAPALAAAAGQGEQLLVAGTSCAVKPWRPQWWPADWGTEEQQGQ